MRHILITIVFLASSFTAKSQGFLVGIGYGTSNIFTMEVGFESATQWNYKFVLGNQLPTGTEGEKYTVINWDELSEDHIAEGAYWSRYDLVIGKRIENFYIDGILGYAPKTLYRNCFDSFYILGDNGYYYKEARGGGKINIGVGAGVYLDMVYLGVDATTVGGINFKIGLFIN